MYGLYFINDFIFYYDAIVDKHINPITCFDFLTIVDDRKGYLTFYILAAFGQLISETFLIRRLQQSGSKCAMNLDRRVNNHRGYIFNIHKSWCFFVKP